MSQSKNSSTFSPDSGHVDTGKKSRARESDWLVQAVHLQPADPELHLGRAMVLQRQQRLDAALAAIDRALAVKPEYGAAYAQLGDVLKDLGRIDDALASYDRAIARDPGHAPAYAGKSIALLLTERLKPGWELYEWRWSVKKTVGTKPSSSIWNGTSHCESLLLLPEQGLGDEIFFSGMVHDLVPYADKLTLIADPRLVSLFQRSFGPHGVEVVSKLAPIPEFSDQVPLGSVGRYFRSDSHSFASVRSPYLEACSTTRESPRNTLHGAGELVCGLSWSSRNAAFGDEKSHDLEGLAALIDACDVVVTVSNTTAHLAGALGRPALVLLPSGRGLMWYWHLERGDSPWYPSLKLFRQARSGEWSGVIEQTRQEVLHRIPA